VKLNADMSQSLKYLLTIIVVLAFSGLVVSTAMAAMTSLVTEVVVMIMVVVVMMVVGSVHCLLR